jgi:hypothetical protein
VHDLKQVFEILSTDEGMQTDSSDEHPSNADRSRAEISDPGSNVNLERLVQSLKQDAEIPASAEEIQSNSSDEHP